MSEDGHKFEGRGLDDVAAPAVSQADRMTTSASSCRSKISRKLSSPSDPAPPNDVTNAGRGGQSGRGAVTRPWVAKCRIEKPLPSSLTALLLASARSKARELKRQIEEMQRRIDKISDKD